METQNETQAHFHIRDTLSAPEETMLGVFPTLEATYFYKAGELINSWFLLGSALFRIIQNGQILTHRPNYGCLLCRIWFPASPAVEFLESLSEVFS